MSDPAIDNPSDAPRDPSDGLTYPSVHVQLTGINGNVYVIIGAVAAALRREVSADAAEAFTAVAYACHSYDEVLVLAMNTVDVD
jgi:hypothetical protein